MLVGVRRTGGCREGTQPRGACAGIPVTDAVERVAISLLGELLELDELGLGIDGVRRRRKAQLTTGGQQPRRPCAGTRLDELTAWRLRTVEGVAGV